MLRRPAAALAVAAVAAAGCSGDRGACWGLHVGDRVDVTVVDTYDINSTSPWPGRSGAAECGYGSDLAQGLVLQATVAAMQSDDISGCQVAIADYASAGGWTWSRAPLDRGPGADAVLDGVYSATNGSCAGLTSMTVSAVGDGDPFTPSVPGQLPHAVLYRTFSPTGGACGGCNSHLVVDLARQ